MPTSSRESWIQSHSNEVENRLTVGEVERGQIERRLTEQRLSHEYLKEDHEELQERFSAMSKRMALHEKAILGILGLLQVVLQDKYPALAALLKSLTP